MSGYAIVICIMLITFAAVVIVLTLGESEDSTRSEQPIAETYSFVTDNDPPGMEPVEVFVEESSIAEIPPELVTGEADSPTIESAIIEETIAAEVVDVVDDHEERG